MDDDVDDHGDGNDGNGATVQRTMPSYNVVVDDDADDHGDGDDGNGATVQRTTPATTDDVDDHGDGGRQRVVNRTINLPFDMKLMMYSQSRAPPSMRDRQGSLNEMSWPANVSVLSFPT